LNSDTAAARQPPSILVVDDDESIRTVVETCLKHAGYNVMTATGRAPVLCALAAREFDLVITDVLMPEIDGAEVITASRMRQPGAAILAMSGGGSYLTAEFCLKMATQMGAGAPLMKPFHLDELLTAVRNALACCRPEQAAC
jgi:DNA-binding NtrC family response regulator